MSENSRTTEQMLFDAVCTELLRQVESGECSAAEMKNAIDFLRHNNITADALQHLGLGELAKQTLPFPSKELN